jgi:hypothetical protein
VIAALVIASLACGPVAQPSATTEPPPPPTTPPPATEAPPAEEGGKAEGDAEAAEAPGKAASDKTALGAEAETTGKAESDKGPGMGPAAASQTPRLLLINDTSQDVCYVYISQTTDSNWGSDWLGSDEILQAGGERTFEVEPGTWDMLATDCSGNEVASQYAVVVTADLVWQLSTTGGQAGDTTLTVVNTSGTDLCYLYLSPSTSDTWGADWLGSGTIPAGGQQTFSLDAGTWDLLARDCSNNVLDEQYGIDLSGDMTWTIYGMGATGSASLEVVNNGSTSVCYVYISPTTSDSWGNDWLGSDTIAAGSSYVFYMDAGSYDLMATDCSGNTLDQQMGVDISGSMTWTIGQGGGTGGGTLTLTNNSGATVCYVYISPTTATEWGDDWLGTSTVASGSSYTFNVPAGSYDLKAEDCSHNVLDVQFGISISGSMTWTIGGSAGGESVSLELINNSGTAVCYVYISPSDASEWGSDWLGSSTIASGSSYVFSFDPGTWDLMAEDCSGNVLDSQFGVYLSGYEVWTIGGSSGGGGDALITIVNNTGQAVCYVWVGPPASEWDGDLLGSSILDVGQTISVYLPVGTWALQAESCGGQVLAYTDSFYASNGAVFYIP